MCSRHSEQWSLFHAQVHQQFRSRQLAGKGAKLLLAVSGGQDSVCLLKLCVDLQPRWQWQLAVVHCDHGWRTDSAESAQFVERLCRRWQIPYHGVTAASSPATEAAARQWRYQVFADVAQTYGYSHVGTGHTLTDRAETFLYNLLRGSGSTGLQALQWQRPLSKATPHIQLIRPLLRMSRAETAAFCQDFNLPFWTDSTNADVSYTRNRIRLELMPYLQENFNTRVEGALAQTAEILATEEDYLEQQALQVYDQTVIIPEMPGAPWRIQRHRLRDYHPALQRRVLRHLLQQMLPRQVTFEQVEKLLGLLAAPNRSQTDPFPGGAIATVAGEIILIQANPTENSDR